jgi:hypothetical protein
MAHKQATDSNLLIKYGEKLGEHFACFLAFCLRSSRAGREHEAILDLSINFKLFFSGRSNLSASISREFSLFYQFPIENTIKMSCHLINIREPREKLRAGHEMGKQYWPADL